MRTSPSSVIELMKIAYVSDAVYPGVTRGVEKRAWELAKRLGDRHEVHWYGRNYSKGPAVRRRNGIVFHEVMEPPTNLYTDGRRPIQPGLSFASRLVTPLLEQRFDVIDCQQFPYFPCFPGVAAGEVTEGSR